MFTDFDLLKLNRAVWIALIEKWNITEGCEYFETYLDTLASLDGDEDFKNQVAEEYDYSKTYFVYKLSIQANEFVNLQDYKNALLCYTAIFKYKDDDPKILKEYVKCLSALGQTDLETKIIERINELGEEDATIYKDLAMLHSVRRGGYKKSVYYMDKYIALTSEPSALDYNICGHFCNAYFAEAKDINLLNKAVRCFKKANELEPYDPSYVKNMTVVAPKINDYKLGREYWDKLFKLQPDSFSNDSKYDYAAYCLKVADFEGWREYFDSRFEKETGATAFPDLGDKPRWNGEDISDKTLLVHYEQGYGDIFLTWGYIPRLVKLAKHVIFVTQNSTVELLKNNDFGVEVLPGFIDMKYDDLEYDCYVPAMSIPIVLKCDRSNISVGEGYIKANERYVKQAKEILVKDNGRLKIGLSYKGNKDGNLLRDIKPSEFQILDKLENVDFYSLTKETGDYDFDCFKNNKVINAAKYFKDFSDTAAIISCLDVVITSDNCILNLAGALGKKTYGLFEWSNEFRWFDLTGENVVWYTSVKPFVNNKMNNWKYSIEKAMEQLKKDFPDKLK